MLSALVENWTWISPILILAGIVGLLWQEHKIREERLAEAKEEILDAVGEIYASKDALSISERAVERRVAEGEKTGGEISDAAQKLFDGKISELNELRETETKRLSETLASAIRSELAVQFPTAGNLHYLASDEYKKMLTIEVLQPAQEVTQRVTDLLTMLRDEVAAAQVGAESLVNQKIAELKIAEFDSIYARLDALEHEIVSRSEDT